MAKDLKSRVSFCEYSSIWNIWAAKKLLFCCSFSTWREICASLIFGFRHRPQMVFIVRAVFTHPRVENLIFWLRSLVIGGSHGRDVKMSVRLPVGSAAVASEETWFCFLFSMPTVTAMFYPQVWPWLCSRSVRFTRNKTFFLAHCRIFLNLFYNPTRHTHLSELPINLSVC